MVMYTMTVAPGSSAGRHVYLQPQLLLTWIWTMNMNKQLSLWVPMLALPRFEGE